MVFYVLPPAGDTKFSFMFRPRFAMEARSEPSLLHDYYNPEAQAVGPPVRLAIRQ